MIHIRYQRSYRVAFRLNANAFIIHPFKLTNQGTNNTEYECKIIATELRLDNNKGLPFVSTSRLLIIELKRINGKLGGNSEKAACT